MIYRVKGCLTDGVIAVKYVGQKWHSDMSMSEISGERVPLPDDVVQHLIREQKRKLTPNADVAQAAWEGHLLRLSQMPKERRPPLKPRTRRGWGRIGQHNK